MTHTTLNAWASPWHDRARGGALASAHPALSRRTDRGNCARRNGSWQRGPGRRLGARALEGC
eukprot:11124099-Lingulodinium_polyedra.AAC.1